MTRSFLAGERPDLADAVLAARPLVGSLLVLAAALGASLGAFLGCGSRTREHRGRPAWRRPPASGRSCRRCGPRSTALPGCVRDAPPEAALEPLFTFPLVRLERAMAVETDDEDNVYVATGDRLVALALDGSVRWSVRDGWPENAPVGAPMLTRDGLVAVAAGEAVFAFDRGGRRAWSYAPAESGGWVEVLLAAPEGGLYASYVQPAALARRSCAASGLPGRSAGPIESESRTLLVSLVSSDRAGLGSGARAPGHAG